MGATLDALHQLQRLEQELLSIRHKINAKHRAVRTTTKKIQQIETELSTKRDQLKHEQSNANRAELDRQVKDQEIAKLREALNKAKTNKEYSALLTQINTDKADNSKLEERVLTMYTAVEQIQKNIGELEEAHKQEKARLKDLQEAAEAFENTVRSQVKDLENRREQASQKLAPAALQVFSRVCERHDGEALAQVIQVNPRREEFICGGCNMSVPLERINALQSRDEIQLCQNCGRLLYIDEPTAT